MKLNILDSQNDDNPLLALSLLIFGVVILSLQDALIKMMSSETSFWQLQFLRSICNITLLILIAYYTNGFKILFPINWKPVYLRAFMMTCCMFCFFSASPILSVAQMAAGLYTYPLFVSIMAFTILKEKMGIWRLSALILGSLGALMILQPWSHDFIYVQLLPVLAGFFYASNIILIRKHCRKESVMSLTLAVGVMFLISATIGTIFFEFIYISEAFIKEMPFIALGWPPLTMIVFCFAIICSFLNLFGNLSLAKAYQSAESSWLAPLDYSYLFFAAIWSKLLFGFWPTTMNLVGICFIAFSGILIAWREKVKKVVR
jgi:drug/metabolite transporter (DMT)-like permease